MSSNNKPHAEIRDVTPEWAMRVLEKHSKSISEGTFRQRNIIQRTVATYAQDMRAGNWGLTGQGITFDVDGNLLDGQHRLYAVCKAGITVKMLIMWDCPVEVNGTVKTINTIDSGRKRDLAAQMSIAGLANRFCLASATRLLMVLAGHDRSQKVSPAQGMAVYNLMEDHIQSIFNIMYKDEGKKSRYSGMVIAPLALFHSADATVAELFSTELHDMTNLSKTSPVLLLAKYLDRDYVVARGSDAQIVAMRAVASALFLYTNEKRQEMLRGNQEHLEWLQKTCKNAIEKIREVSGMTLTMEELGQKG